MSDLYRMGECNITISFDDGTIVRGRAVVFNVDVENGIRIQTIGDRQFRVPGQVEYDVNLKMRNIEISQGLPREPDSPIKEEEKKSIPTKRLIRE